MRLQKTPSVLNTKVPVEQSARLTGNPITYLDVSPAHLLVDLARSPKGSENKWNHLWVSPQVYICLSPRHGVKWTPDWGLGVNIEAHSLRTTMIGNLSLDRQGQAHHCACDIARCYLSHEWDGSGWPILSDSAGSIWHRIWNLAPEQTEEGRRTGGVGVSTA